MNNNNETKWFAHDVNDELEPAFIAMCSQYKMEGYGRWWKIIETLRRGNEYKYNIAEPFAYSVLAIRMMITEDEARHFIAELINTFHLLQTDDEYIWSGWLTERMVRMDKRKKALSEAGIKGNNIRREMKNALRAARERTANTPDTQGERVEQEERSLKIAHNTTEQNKTQQKKPQTPKGALEPADAVNSFSEKQEQSVQTPPQPNTGIKFPLHGAEEVEDGIFDTHRAAALADERRFVYPHITARKITRQQLGRWLTAFNRVLEYRNELPKSEQDYRQHFANWFKFRNTDTEDPDTLSVIPLPPPPKPEHNPLGYLKTPEQVRAEQQQQLEDLRRLAREAADTRDKLKSKK